MSKQVITVLSVSPFPEDHVVLENILGPYCWKILPASTLTLAARLLRIGPIHLVVSEGDLTPHSWRDLLADIHTLAAPPFLIVTSRCADEYLWAEAINLGAYDVLTKPFEEAEVRRALSVAAVHWRWNQEPAAAPLARAAGE